MAIHRVFETVRRTARKRCLSGLWMVASLSRGPGVLRRRSGLLQAGSCFAARCLRMNLVRKPLSRLWRACIGQRLHGGPKPTPQDPGKGEACCDGSFRPRSAPRLFRPCRTFRQNTKAPPPARIDTLRDPSGGGRRFRIRQVFGVGKKILGLMLEALPRLHESAANASNSRFNPSSFSHW